MYVNLALIDLLINELHDLDTGIFDKVSHFQVVKSRWGQQMLNLVVSLAFKDVGEHLTDELVTGVNRTLTAHMKGSRMKLSSKILVDFIDIISVLLVKKYSKAKVAELAATSLATLTSLTIRPSHGSILSLGAHCK